MHRPLTLQHYLLTFLALALVSGTASRGMSSPQALVAAAARTQQPDSPAALHTPHPPPSTRSFRPAPRPVNATRYHVHNDSRSSVGSSSSSNSSNAPQKSGLSQRSLQPSSSVNVTRIAVIGERHSGTNFMWRLLSTNLAPSINVTDTFCDYKHRYQLPGSHCPDLQTTLVVVMFRNPYDWTLAMRDNCWCGSEELSERVQSLTLKSFLQLPWHDSLRRRDEVEDLPSSDVVGLTPGHALQDPGDRLRGSDPEGRLRAGDPSTISCDTLLHCRARKLHNFLNISAWAPNVEFVRHEDVITPGLSLSWLSDLIKRYQLPQSNRTLYPIEQYKRRAKIVFNVESAKSKSLWFNPRMAEELPLLMEYRKEVGRLADHDAEAEAGYALGEEE